MGKVVQQQLPVVQQQHGAGGDGVGSRIFCCQRCSMVLTRIAKLFNFKCAAVMLLSLAVSVYTLFSVRHLHSNQTGFDANDLIKLSATVQMSFRLQKPVSELVPRVSQLEYEILGEIGVPSTKVAILSIHQSDTSNWTNVEFGILSDPLHVPINPLFLSVLKSTLIELYLEQSNLTLTFTNFGKPSSFEILKFYGGITLIPEKSPSIWQIPQILFNFTLNNSIDEIKENFAAFKRQLRLGLHLMPGEIVYVEVTNKNGSTRDSPVIVAASITSDSGILLPERLQELAEIIAGSSAKNFGLDNSVFGKVKEVRLSSSLNRSLHASPPTPSPSPLPSSSPSPSPLLNDSSRPSISPSSLSLSDAPAPLPRLHHLAPCSSCDALAPSDACHAFATSPENYSHRLLPSVPNSPIPSMKHDSSYHGSRIPPTSSPRSHTYPTDHNLSPIAFTQPSKGLQSPNPPGHSPLPSVSYGSNHGQDNETRKNLASPPPVLPSVSASSLSLMPSSHYIWWIYAIGLSMQYLLCSTF